MASVVPPCPARPGVGEVADKTSVGRALRRMSMMVPTAVRGLPRSIVADLRWWLGGTGPGALDPELFEPASKGIGMEFEDCRRASGPFDDPARLIEGRQDVCALDFLEARQGAGRRGSLPAGRCRWASRSRRRRRQHRGAKLERGSPRE